MLAERRESSVPGRRPLKRRVVWHRDEAAARVELACAAMAGEGAAITVQAVALRAGIARNSIIRHPELREMVRATRLAVAARTPDSPGPGAPGAPGVAWEPVPGAEPGEMTLGLLAEQWVWGRVARGEIARNSGATERGRLTGFLGDYAQAAPASLDRHAVERCQATIGRLAPSTRRRYLGTLGLFCEWLVLEGHLQTNPAAAIKRPREPRRVPRALDSYEVARILNLVAGDLRWQAIVWLMVGCGLRCIECSRLDLADWARGAEELQVVGKAGHERVLPVPSPVGDALAAYVSVRGWRAGPLFMAEGSKGQPDGRMSAKWMSKRVAQLLVEAGVHETGDGKTAHALRHTAASDVYKACRDIRLVQEFLGHSSLQSTQMYLRRVDLGEMRKALESRPYMAGSPVGL